MDKSNKYIKLFKNVGIFTIGNFGSKIVSFLMIPLYTAVLSTSEYGTVDLISSMAQLLTPILLLSIQDATLRFTMDSPYKKEDVLSTSIKIILYGSALLLVGIIIFVQLSFYSLSITYYIFLFFTFFFGALNTCFILYLKGKNKASIIAVSGIICTFVTCILNVILLVIFKFGITGYMIGNVAGIMFSCIYQLFMGDICRNIHIFKYTDLSKQMIKYSCPLIANSVAWWVNNASDKYILTFFCGIATNGIYSVAYKIPTVLTTFQSVFYNAWSISAIAEYDENDSDGFIGNSYALFSFISILLCSILILINIPISHFLYSGVYRIAWQSVPFLLVSTVFNGVSQFEGSIFAATRKTKMVALTTVIGAILNTVCNFTFIFLWGAVGASFATMIGYFTTWLLRTIFLRDIIHMKVNWLRHYLALILLVIQSILATLNILFILQMLIVFLVIFLNSNYIKHILIKVLK